MMKNCITISFIVFTFCGFLYAQEAVPFKVQNEFFIYGDAAVIGNNILSKDAKKPFNDISLTNDDINMVFVDIDNDSSTFSSSSASLKLPKNHSKIVYAALYWSATYSYEEGYRKESAGQFIFQGKRVNNRENIHKIKFKTPSGDYKNINGKVLFDGAKNTSFRLNSPYVCMADVTKLLQKNDIVNGEYTIANVMATKGFVSGGSAAGWLLYVIYEAPTKNPKYITTYNGFAHVNNQPLKLKFNNFKALEKGEIQTSLTFAALEGDSALKEDECILINPISKRLSLLSTENRPRNNFFNSKITYSNTAFNERSPKSENTLGFDIVSMDVPNESQPLIDNTTTEIEMAFNTNSDRFYMFFTAFQTEISKTFYEENKDNTVIEITDVEKPKIIVSEKPKKEKITKKKQLKKEIENTEIAKTTVPQEKQKVNKTNQNIFTSEKQLPSPEAYKTKTIEKEKPLPVWLQKKQTENNVTITQTDIYQPNITLQKPVYSNTSLVMNRENYEKLLTIEDYVYETQKFKRILNQEPNIIAGVEKGYYIIAGLLYDLDYAINYQKELQEKGVNSKIFKDISKGHYYVYLFNSENFYDVFMLRKAFIKSEFLEQVWILNINIEKQVIKKL